MRNQRPLIHGDYELDPEGFPHLDCEPEIALLRGRIFALNQASANQAPIREKRYCVVGCPPEANTFLDHFNMSVAIVDMIRTLMREKVDEIVVADEPLALNMLRRRTYPEAAFYQMFHSSSLKLARAEAKVIGHRYRMYLQAIQEYLILSGQANLQNYVPILLMSQNFPRYEVQALFSRLFSLTEPESLLAEGNIIDFHEAPFTVRDEKSAKNTWQLIPLGIRMAALGERGRLDYDELPREEQYKARQTMAYKFFQDAYVIWKGGEKIGFEGEKKLDEETKNALRYADELGLDKVSRALSFFYPAIESGTPLSKAHVPYRSVRFGSKVNVEVLALGGYSKINDLEKHLAEVMEKYFPIVENDLSNIQEDPALIDLPDHAFRSTEAIDYLRHMLERMNDGSGCRLALEAAGIEMDFDPALLDAPMISETQRAEIEKVFEGLRQKIPWGVFSIEDPVQNLREMVFKEGAATPEPIRSDMLRREVMHTLKELTAALRTDPELKTILEASGLSQVISEECPISGLNGINETSADIDQLSDHQQKMAKIVWLRDRIVQLKARIRNFDRDEEAWREMIPIQQELFDLILNKASDGEEAPESLLAYLIRQMGKVLSKELCKKPKLADVLTDFFRRLTKVLHPHLTLTVDCSKAYWH